MDLVEALELCKTLGCKNVEIKGDSTIIINAIRKGSLINWRLEQFYLEPLHYVKPLTRSESSICIGRAIRERVN